MATIDTHSPELLFDRVQELQERLDAHADEQTGRLASELVSAVVAMYGAGLERIVGRMSSADPALAAELAEDPLVAALLLIHDLHPVALEQRVSQALDSVRPYMESHGGGVRLLSVTDGVARIHLQGSCSDCSASAATLELAIEQALEEAAPDLVGLEVEGIAPALTGAPLPMAGGEPSGLELPMVMSAPVPSAPTWFELDGAPSPGGLESLSVAGARLLVANVDGTLLAFHDGCAACGGALHAATLSEGALACPGCGRQFFLPRAGRSLDGDGLQLEPVPLLREDGRVRVALR